MPLVLSVRKDCTLDTFGSRPLGTKLGIRIARVLDDDYKVMSALDMKARRTEDRSEQAFLWGEFVQMAGSHLLALETIIIPALNQCGASQRVEELALAIGETQAVLSELLITEKREDDFPLRLAELAMAMQRLHDREGARLAMTLTESLDDGALHLLGIECDHFLSLRRLQVSISQQGDLT